MGRDGGIGASVNDERWDILSEQHVRRAREAGALADLQLALSQRISLHLFAGELSTAASLGEELQATTEAIGSTLAPYGRVGLLALRGSEAEAVSLIEGSRAEVTRRGEGIGISAFEWAKAVLYNGLGRYEEARVYASRIGRTSAGYSLGRTGTWPSSSRPPPSWNTRAGHRSSPSSRGNDHGKRHGLGPRDRGPGGALLAEDKRAGVAHVEAIQRLGRTRIATDLARAHLLYGEWLRRQRRRTHARNELKAAHELFTDFGMDAFAERARVELEATGERARKRTMDTSEQLTPQELQVARLAAQGNTNREIAAQLFISPNTVEYHLRKAFRKLDVKSRTQLANRLRA